MAAMKQCIHSLDYASESLRHDKDIIMAAVPHHGADALLYAPGCDREIIMAAVQQDGEALRYVKESRYQKYRGEVLLAEVSSEQKNETPSRRTSTRKSLRRLVKDEENVLLRCTLEYREIVMMAVQQNGRALEYAPLSLKNDAEIVMAAVQQKGYALRYAPETLTRKRNYIVMGAVKQDGFALRYAPTPIRYDRQICLAAVQQDAKHFSRVTKSLKNDKEIAMVAIQQDGQLYNDIPEELQDDLDIMATVIKNKRKKSNYSTVLNLEKKSFKL